MAKTQKIQMSSDDLIRFRDRHKLGYTELADILGVTPGCIHHWETGQRAIPETTKRVILLFDQQPNLMEDF